MDNINFDDIEAKLEEITLKRTKKLQRLLSIVDERVERVERLRSNPPLLLEHLLNKRRATLPGIIEDSFEAFFSNSEFSKEALSDFLRLQLDSFGTAGSDLGDVYIDFERAVKNPDANIKLQGSQNISEKRFNKIIDTKWEKMVANNSVDDLQGWKDWVVARTVAHHNNRVRYSIKNNIEYANRLIEFYKRKNIKREGYFIVPSPLACSWCLFVASAGFLHRSHELDRIRSLHGSSGPVCHCRVIYSTIETIKNTPQYAQTLRIKQYYKKHITNVFPNVGAKKRQQIFIDTVKNGEFSKHTGIKTVSLNPLKVKYKNAFTLNNKPLSGQSYIHVCKTLEHKPLDIYDVSKFKTQKITTNIGEVYVTSKAINHVIYGDVPSSGGKHRGRHVLEKNNTDYTPFSTLERYITTTKFKSDVKTFFPLEMTKEQIVEEIVDKFKQIKIDAKQKGKEVIKVEVDDMKFIIRKNNISNDYFVETAFLKYDSKRAINMVKPT